MEAEIERSEKENKVCGGVEDESSMGEASSAESNSCKGDSSADDEAENGGSIVLEFDTPCGPAIFNTTSDTFIESGAESSWIGSISGLPIRLCGGGADADDESDVALEFELTLLRFSNSKTSGDLPTRYADDEWLTLLGEFIPIGSASMAAAAATICTDSGDLAPLWLSRLADMDGIRLIETGFAEPVEETECIWLTCGDKACEVEHWLLEPPFASVTLITETRSGT